MGGRVCEVCCVNSLAFIIACGCVTAVQTNAEHLGHPGNARFGIRQQQQCCTAHRTWRSGEITQAPHDLLEVGGDKSQARSDTGSDITHHSVTLGAFAENFYRRWSSGLQEILLGIQSLFECCFPFCCPSFGSLRSWSVVPRSSVCARITPAAAPEFQPRSAQPLKGLATKRGPLKIISPPASRFFPVLVGRTGFEMAWLSLFVPPHGREMK